MINTVPATARPATAGLDRVMGKDARTLVTLFGAADQDIQEVTGRKLQFETRSCILDTYLYAAAPGREPLVTFAEARQPDGKDADAAACIAAMAKRK